MGFGRKVGEEKYEKGKGTMNRPDPKLQTRNLPYRIHRDLCKLLDKPGDKDWRALISVLPDGMYGRDQIAAFENAERIGKSASSELLTDLGYQLLTVKQLIGYLTRMNHQEALLLLKRPEPVEITTQPLPISINEGSTARLVCAAKGFPRPAFQWIKVGHGELDIGIDKELVLDNVTAEDDGRYLCRVSNDVNTVDTDTVTIRIVPMEPAPRRDMDGLLQNQDLRFQGLVVDDTATNRLKPINVLPGQYFVLSCGIEDRPDLDYHWMKNGYAIPGENQSKLIFNSFKVEDEGHYSCRIVGPEGDMLTKLMELKAGSLLDRQFATGKVALIIGNQDYECERTPHLELVHPADDAKTLAAVLREMGFRVLCMVDLNREEMLKAIDGFCEMLRMSAGMYGLFYFGGHGYEENGKTYLVPVDAPSEWSPQNTVCADDILSQMQHSKTKLNMLILDVCRTPPGNNSLPEKNKSFDSQFIPGSQSIICYATCPQSQAFERRNDTNGIYMKHLIRHIRKDKRIEEIVIDVHADVSSDTERCVSTKTMSPTYNSSLTKYFSLCDPILYDLDGDPTLRWFQHHRLPSSQIVGFKNDIKVKLSFESVCSNICNLVLHVVDVGRSTKCDVQLLEISKAFRIEEENMNRVYPISLDLIPRSNPGLMQETGRALDYEKKTTLPNLQKIEGNVAITLEAKYENDDNKEKRENTCLIINMSEFGITSLFTHHPTN